ncbi:AraC family transcriptional regulator [Burkholderiales bacterium GJ-E10]|nr:AraC family transcriptional regulator [Burkholderiales bacterium GJ-E10]
MLETRHGLQALRRADVVIVPSWRDLDKPVPEPVRNAVQAAHRRGATVVGLCLGAFVLAESGLLDGRSATTHWHWAEIFSDRFPKVRLDPTVLYIDEGRVVTSAGTVAAIDCCLYLLRRWCGAETANRVAKRLVVSPHRRGGQAQFIEQVIPLSGRDARLQDLLAWMGERLHERHSVDSLARRVAMSPRNFTRQFRKATGTAALRWLQHQRLALAARLLETTDRPVETIAILSGFGSALSLRQHFSAAFGVPPTIYRRQFGGTP